MRVRLSLDVGDYTRFVIAQYYGANTTRARRREVRRFVAAAIETMASDVVDGLTPRKRAAAKRLEARRAELPFVDDRETIDRGDRPTQPALF